MELKTRQGKKAQSRIQPAWKERELFHRQEGPQRRAFSEVIRFLRRTVMWAHLQMRSCSRSLKMWRQVSRQVTEAGQYISVILRGILKEA